MKIISQPEVKKKFELYPKIAKQQLNKVRQLIFEEAERIEDINEIEECLKWGEPSYVTKTGSTIRMDWKAKNADQFAIYFNCNSKLVNTFKQIYKNEFQYEGNRALVFGIKDNINEDALKHCISLAITYHKIKHLPLLGV